MNLSPMDTPAASQIDRGGLHLLALNAGTRTAAAARYSGSWKVVEMSSLVASINSVTSITDTQRGVLRSVLGVELHTQRQQQ